MMEKPKSGFIAGPIADTVFLIASPLLAIALFIPFATLPIYRFPLQSVTSSIETPNLCDAFIHVVIFGHLFIVFFRSHLNPSIFKRHIWRFTAVPVSLFLLAYSSTWFLAALTVLTVWWDVYHSALQTFGIGRIYDMKKGNHPLAGRRLDWYLNLLLYFGPILGGTSLMLQLLIQEKSLESMLGFNDLMAALFDWNPDSSDQLEQVRRWLSYILCGVGIPFCIYYVYAYWKLAQQGYNISFQKVFLLLILAVVSITCWGFNPFGSAFFVMNFFHAWQYFFIVWFMEQKNITAFFHLGGVPVGRYIALAMFVAIGMAYGVWTIVPGLQLNYQIMMSITVVVSLMHFWYDGFIWSVRRGQVQ